MAGRAAGFWGVRDGRLGLLSAKASLIGGLVIGASVAWTHSWWTGAAMAILVARALVAFWLERRARQPLDVPAADLRPSAGA